MRYHYTPSTDRMVKDKGIKIVSYKCDHPLYNRCTLYFTNGIGLAVVREYFNQINKHRWWGEVDKELAEDIYRSEKFEKFFQKFAGPKDNDMIFPTISVRKIMWQLRMKPLEKEIWEKCEV